MCTEVEKTRISLAENMSLERSQHHVMCYVLQVASCMKCCMAACPSCHKLPARMQAMQPVLKDNCEAASAHCATG